MSYVSEEQIREARQMDLLSYLRANDPSELVHISGQNYRADPAGILCRRADPERGQELPEELCSGVSGGRDHRTGLHYLLRICRRTTGGGSGRSSGYDGLELYRRTDF